MFGRTAMLQAPVVTLLSPSLSTSKKAAGLLTTILSSSSTKNYDESPRNVLTTTQLLPKDSEDALDHVFASSIPGLSRSCRSVGVVCPLSGSVVHFCSIDSTRTDNDNNNDNNNHNHPFALLSITESSTNHNDDMEQNATESIQHCRQLLSDHLEKNSSTANSVNMNFKSLLNRPLTSADLLHETDGLPLLSLGPQQEEQREQKATSSADENYDPSTSSPFLKEVVVPFFDYAQYEDGSTILSKLSQFPRPSVGVYQWPTTSNDNSNGICIRPLPTAAEDKRLPPPSLIFHCNDSADGVVASVNSFNNNSNNSAPIQMARIGYAGGMMNKGQTMLIHDDFQGLDVRLCPSQTVSSHFSEAQESLLAGSLPELQNSNILLAQGEQAVDDERTNNSDCWVEVRANLKRPAGFLNRKNTTVFGAAGGSVMKQKIAKVPDIPYE